MATFTTPEQVAQLMIEGFTDRVKAQLKKEILDKLMPDVDAAVDLAFAGFKVAVEQHKDMVNIASVVRVILEKRSYS